MHKLLFDDRSNFRFGKLVSITGISGSGKSTPIDELLHPALQHSLSAQADSPRPQGEQRRFAAVNELSHWTRQKPQIRVEKVGFTPIRSIN